tara:strand:- start:468 stop:623 length:156 start_codon:yes stop_codon:yes gene_type:complete
VAGLESQVGAEVEQMVPLVVDVSKKAVVSKIELIAFFLVHAYYMIRGVALK